MPATPDDNKAPAPVPLPDKRSRWSFRALLALQAQNAFNDNTVRFILLPLGTAVAAQMADVAGPHRHYQHVLLALMILPYLFFSPLAGWLADRFPKNRVIIGTLLLQTLVFVLIALCVQTRSLWPATAGFFLLAVQSTLLSPTKTGIIKELVGPARLSFANGWIQMSLILAILGGTFLGGWWYDSRLRNALDAGADDAAAPWLAATGPIWILAGATLIALALAFGVRHTPAQRPDAPLQARLLWSHFGELAHLFRRTAIRRCAIGATFFWAAGAMVQLIIVQVALDLTGGGEGMGSSASLMVACASGGVALGSILAALLSRRRTELGLIPLGSLLMAGSALFVALALPGTPAFMIGLTLLGTTSALWYIPLFALFQEIAPEHERGRLLASVNILNNIGMIAATVLQLAMIQSGIPVSWQFALIGLASAVVAIYVTRLLPGDFFRLLILPVIRLLYRIRVTGKEHFPEKGGVLLVANHVSFIDAFILSTACPRPIRFLMHERFYRIPLFTWFLDIFGAIPISPLKAKDALRKAAAALEAEEVVCLFPEGVLSTDGKLGEFQRGMEIILRSQPGPVVPAALIGLWGSWFSHSGKGPFTGLPRIPKPVSVAFGPTLKPSTTAAEARREVAALLGELKEHSNT